MSETYTDDVYLDYAASTPMRKEVREVMQPYWSEHFANPQSSHDFGQKAHQAIAEARSTIAKLLSVKSSEIIFTSGATEANSLAIKGRCKNPAENKPAAAISAGSHPSLLSAEAAGISTQLLPLKNSGRINQSELANRVSNDTAVISIPYVNSTVGSIEPLSEVRNLLAQNIEDRQILHTDASQAGSFLSLQPEPLGVDMMTINSHKLYGPKGVGLLWVRSGTPLSSLFMTDTDYVVGDYQVLRPGTPPVPLIVGFAKALTLAQTKYREHSRYVRDLQQYLLEQLNALDCEIILNGPRKGRVANNVNISIADVDHKFLATQLNQKGVAVSASTACQSQAGRSQILSNLPNTLNSGLRITLGLDSQKKDIDKLITALRQIITN